MSVSTTSTPAAASRSASPRGGLLVRHPLASFFLLAYALTWLGWSPWFLSEAGVGLLPFDGGEFDVFFNVAGLVLGPTLSAFVVTGAAEGRDGVRRLLRRIVRWRVRPRWYLFVLAGIPAIRPSTPPDAFPELTERENEILELIARHETNPEIAKRLYLSPKTVRNHVSNIFGKLQVVDRAEVVMLAREAGLGRSRY